MLRINFAGIIAIFCMSVLIYIPHSIAAEKEPSVQVINIGEHYFEKKDCVPYEFSDSYNECGCKIAVKYVQHIDNKAINDLLKPIDELSKYCDYDYEQGLDAEHSAIWTEVVKGESGSSMFEYSISQEASFLSRRWLNVTDYSYVFSGGAHGNTGMDSLLFDLKTNKQIDIATLINPKKIPEANRSIQDQLNTKGEGEVFPEFINLEEPSYIKEDSSCELCVYVLKDSGIYAVFQQYGVGPYSSGFIEVKLPDDVLLNDSGIVFKK